MKLGFNLSKTSNSINILLINSCQKMAKEISSELLKTLPGAYIAFTPTLALARIMIPKISFDLIVSNSMLPDGNFKLLEALISRSDKKPDILVIKSNQDLLRLSTSFTRKKVPGGCSSITELASVKDYSIDPIKALGADLRNDLNNPLQEIVSMLYVAKSQSGESEIAGQALKAIERAAGNLTSVVKGLEDKIRIAVG